MKWFNKLFDNYLEVSGRLPGSLYVLCPVDIAQLAQAEAIPSRWIHVAIHSHYRTCGRHLKRLPDLDIHLKVRDRAPVFWSWNKPTCILRTIRFLRLYYIQGLSSICSKILTRVIGYGGLERNFIGNRPCEHMWTLILRGKFWNHTSSYDVTYYSEMSTDRTVMVPKIA